VRPVSTGTRCPMSADRWVSSNPLVDRPTSRCGAQSRPRHWVGRGARQPPVEPDEPGRRGRQGGGGHLGALRPPRSLSDSSQHHRHLTQIDGTPMFHRATPSAPTVGRYSDVSRIALTTRTVRSSCRSSAAGLVFRELVRFPRGVRQVLVQGQHGGLRLHRMSASAEQEVGEIPPSTTWDASSPDALTSRHRPSLYEHDDQS
jgi:hypothetical protein